MFVNTLANAVADLSYDQLQEELGRRGLPFEGPRSALVDRLMRGLWGPPVHMDVDQTMFGVSASTSTVAPREPAVTNFSGSTNRLPDNRHLQGRVEPRSAHDTGYNSRSGEQPLDLTCRRERSPRTEEVPRANSHPRYFPVDQQRVFVAPPSAMPPVPGIAQAQAPRQAQPWVPVPYPFGTQASLNYDVPAGYWSQYACLPRPLQGGAPPDASQSMTYCPAYPPANTAPASRSSPVPEAEYPRVGTSRPNYPRSGATAIHDIMRKWNLGFSGARGEDADDFLIRIEEGRSLVHVSDTELMSCLPFFLSGIALHWFRNERRKWSSWRECEQAWRRRFGDPDLQFSLREEILRRTQGIREPVTDYLTCLRALFDRVKPPMSESEQLGYAHRNLLPRYQVAIAKAEAQTVDDLERIVVRIEKCYRSAEYYQAPPLPEKSLFPKLAYRAPLTPRRPSSATYNILDAPYGVQHARVRFQDDPGESHGAAIVSPRMPRYDTPRTPVRSSLARSPSGSPGVPRSTGGRAQETADASSHPVAICWNCDGVGHFSKGCTQPRRRHCYRCGQRDVTTTMPHECAGNAEGGHPRG